jgi:hypothetical protein
VQKLKDAFLDSLFDYQRVWWDNIGERAPDPEIPPDRRDLVFRPRGTD